MVTVAIVGTGNLGRQILKSLLPENGKPKHTVIALSRTPQPWISARGGEVKIVDYDSPASLSSALQGVDTLISTISTQHPSQVHVYETVQLALLEAAKTAGVRRFAPSEWTTTLATTRNVELYAPKLRVWEAVEASGLEYTAFLPGVFMNYMAHGAPHPRVQQDCFDGLADAFFVGVDFPSRSILIPGTGEERIAFTTTQDIGRFVAAAVDLDVWTPESGFAGWAGTWHQIVEVLESLTGDKVQVTYQSKEELQRSIDASENVAEKFLLQWKLSLAKGEGCAELNLQDKVDVKMTGLKEFLQKWWEL